MNTDTIVTSMTIAQIRGLELIGQGERSKIYQHPTDAHKVIKVTRSKAEKDVLRFIKANPRSFFVNVFSLDVCGAYMVAVIEKLPDVKPVTFTRRDGRIFYETAFPVPTWDHFDLMFGGDDSALQERIAGYISRKVDSLVDSEIVIREYYALLTSARADGFWLPDVAWNLGRRADGSLCCYDATLRTDWCR